ncbi:hypothetical protein GCM10027445_14650 [Amycolatopsis endophytica]|uniref:DUF2000 domain-containing protein n=1 Tax=Amycolatopsis endophytica TaxID=860233 RepID=A0A853B438_9PSEU|nr:DUF2000 domain-containing protein [Amycolatopsis endophytica]NYI89602.1 hypothetical protein [Amycolatopsis endophytica]
MSTEHQVEVQLDATTRTAKVKWVIVADPSLGPGLVANATACLGAAVGKVMPELVGPDVTDASARPHTGLPWTGCSILAADAAKLLQIRTKAANREGIFIADMSKHAQASRSYTEYTEAMANTDEEAFEYYAVALVGPRNKIDKLVGGLPLLR